jgi:hypothetical protein
MRATSPAHLVTDNHTHSPTYAIIKTLKHWNDTFETRSEFLLAGMRVQWDGGSERILLGDNTSGHTAADQVSVCWSLYVNWTTLYIHIIHVTIRIMNSDLGTIRFAPDLWGLNHWKWRELSVREHYLHVCHRTGRHDIHALLHWNTVSTQKPIKPIYDATYKTRSTVIMVTQVWCHW